MTLPKSDSYLPEVWSLYAIGTIVILLRFAVRFRTVGLHGFQGDDYLSGLYLVLYTMNIVIVQYTYYSGGNVDVTPEQVATLPQSDIDVLRFGSQLEFVSWYTYPGTIWTLKFMVLFFYRRITLGVLRVKTIRFLFWFCGTSWIGLILSVSLSCRPYSHNWQIKPLPGPECTFRPQNFWTLCVLNVLTDAALMSIPLPILWHLRVSKRRKLAVAILLLSGVFVISTAIVRMVMTMVGAPNVITINSWGFRETCAGLCAVTAPILCPLFTRGFWRRGRYGQEYVRWRENWLRPGERRESPPFGTWMGMVDGLDDDDLFRDDTDDVGSLEQGHHEPRGGFTPGTIKQGTASIEMSGSVTRRGDEENGRPWNGHRHNNMSGETLAGGNSTGLERGESGESSNSNGSLRKHSPYEEPAEGQRGTCD